MLTSATGDFLVAAFKIAKRDYEREVHSNQLWPFLTCNVIP